MSILDMAQIGFLIVVVIIGVGGIIYVVLNE
jgi:hypothetical protein